MGRGFSPASEMFAYFHTPIRWGTLLRRTVREIRADGCLGLAAQLAYYFFLALFPALLFLMSLVRYLPIRQALDRVLIQLGTVAPSQVLEIVRSQLDQIGEGSHGGILTLGLAGALWSGSAAMTAIISTLNRAYDIEEWRPWWKTRLIAVLLTLGLAVFTILALAIIVSGPWVTQFATSLVGLGAQAALLWRILQWPVAIVLIVVAIDLVYHFAPNADAEWVWVTPGSLVATALWVSASLGLRWYVQHFGGFNATYGAVGGIIVLLLWFYVTGLALLIGAEMNAEIDRERPDRDRGPQNPTRRKRIGPRRQG